MNDSDILLSSSSPKRTAHSSQVNFLPMLCFQHIDSSLLIYYNTKLNIYQIPGSKHAEPSKQTNSTQQLDRKRTAPKMLSSEDILPPKILKSTKKGTSVQKFSQFPSNHAIHLEQNNGKSVVESPSRDQLPVLKQTLQTVSQSPKARGNVKISNHRAEIDSIGIINGKDSTANSDITKDIHCSDEI